MTFKNTKKEQPQSVFWGNKYLEHFPSFARAYLIETHNVSLFSFSEQIIKKKKKELFLFLERKKSRGYRVPVHGQDRQRHVTEWRIASSTGCPIDREYFLFIFVCVAILLKAKQKFIKSFLLIFPFKMKSLPVIRFGRGQQRMWYSCAIESRKRNKIPRISKCFVSFSNVSGFFMKIHP